jgi:hypothetical protein
VFQHHCTTCDRTQLAFLSQVRSLATTEHGIEVSFECLCGERQTLITGSRATALSSRRPAVAA